jgi:AraC-like DNA-binding protein
MKNLDFDIGGEVKCVGAGSVGKSNQLLSENWQRIEKSVRYMAEHLNQPLQASDLATVANLSLSHYFALFKRTIGCAPIDFFIRMRMKRACHLLETTSLNVKEIAGRLGYDDPFYFSRLFKSVNGVAPSDYRAAHQDVAGSGPTESLPDRFLETDWGRDDRIVHGKQSIFHSVPNPF